MNTVEYFEQGLDKLNQEQYAEALIDFSMAIEESPDFCPGYYFIGNCYYRLEYFDKALFYYNKALEVDQNSSSAYFYRGVYYFSITEEYKKALIDYTKAIELEPDDKSSYFCRGRCYEELEQYKEAILDYKKALELGDKDAEELLKNCLENQKITYLNRGYDKLVNGEYIEALEELNIAIAMDINYERAYVHRACCKYELKDYKGSLEDFKIAIALNPKDPISYMNAGMAKYYLDENSTDISYFNKAIKMNPKESGAYFMKGVILKNNAHSYKTALTSFNKAIELEQCCKYYLHRAECYKHLKRYDNALIDYKKAMKLWNKEIKKSSPNVEKINSGIEYCEKALMQASLANN